MSTNLNLTCGSPHKNKQTLSATIKIENDAIAKKAQISKYLSKSTPKSNKNSISDVNDVDDSECTIMCTAVVAINSPPSHRKKK